MSKDNINYRDIFKRYYGEVLWSGKSEYDDLIKKDDKQEQLTRIESNQERIEKKLNRIMIALGCDDKSGIIIV